MGTLSSLSATAEKPMNSSTSCLLWHASILEKSPLPGAVNSTSPRPAMSFWMFGQPRGVPIEPRSNFEHDRDAGHRRRAGYGAAWSARIQQGGFRTLPSCRSARTRPPVEGPPDHAWRGSAGESFAGTPDRRRDQANDHLCGPGRPWWWTLPAPSKESLHIGDFARHFPQTPEIGRCAVGDFMTRKPITISGDKLAGGGSSTFYRCTASTRLSSSTLGNVLLE